MNNKQSFSNESLSLRGRAAGLWLIKSGLDALLKSDPENKIQSIRDLVGVTNDNNLSPHEQALIVSVTYLAFTGLIDAASHIFESSIDKEKMMKLFFENSATHLQTYYNSSPLTKTFFSKERNQKFDIKGLVVTLIVRAYEDKKLNTEEKLYKMATEAIIPRMINIGGGIADFVLSKSDEDVQKMLDLIASRNNGKLVHEEVNMETNKKALEKIGIDTSWAANKEAIIGVIKWILFLIAISAGLALIK